MAFFSLADIINFGGKETNSILSINELIKISQQQNVFKKSVEERAKRVGKVRYLGYKENFYKRNDKLILYYDLYFYVQGEKHKKYTNDYLIIIEIPYKKNIKNMKRLYNAPVKLFCSDPSFIFFGDAYILHNYYNALLLPENRKDIQQFVSYAISNPPKIKNPQSIPYLTKHAFKTIIKFLANEKPSKIFDKRYKLNKHIAIPKWKNKIKLK